MFKVLELKAQVLEQQLIDVNKYKRIVELESELERLRNSL